MSKSEIAEALNDPDLRARQQAIQGLAAALNEMVACACIYYHAHSLQEFSKPIKQARAALEAARPYLDKQ